MTKKPLFQSTRLFQYGIPLAFMSFGILSLIIGILSLVGVKDVTGEKIPIGLAAFIPIGVTLLLLCKYQFKKFRKLRFYENEIVVNTGMSYSWKDVDSVFKIPFTTPPIYRIKFNADKSTYYFGFKSSFYASLIIYSFDFTGFLKYSTTKIKESQI